MTLAGDFPRAGTFGSAPGTAPHELQAVTLGVSEQPPRFHCSRFPKSYGSDLRGVGSAQNPAERVGRLLGDSCIQPWLGPRMCPGSLQGQRWLQIAQYLLWGAGSRIGAWKGFAAGTPCPFGPSPLPRGWEGWSRAVARGGTLLSHTLGHWSPQGTQQGCDAKATPGFPNDGSWTATTQPERPLQANLGAQSPLGSVAIPELPGGIPGASQGCVWSPVLAFGCRCAGPSLLQLLPGAGHREWASLGVQILLLLCPHPQGSLPNTQHCGRSIPRMLQGHQAPALKPCWLQEAISRRDSSALTHLPGLSLPFLL